MKSNIIDSSAIVNFKDEYSFLSNFYLINITFERITYPSVEHAYQAAKTLNIKDRIKIKNCKTPGLAKRMGMKVRLRNNWDHIKDSIMYDLLKQKFENKKLRQLLLNTGNRKLIEGNTWGDVYWGVYEGIGRNKLGLLLMQVRGDINDQ